MTTLKLWAHVKSVLAWVGGFYLIDVGFAGSLLPLIAFCLAMVLIPDHKS